MSEPEIVENGCQDKNWGKANGSSESKKASATKLAENNRKMYFAGAAMPVC